MCHTNANQKFFSSKVIFIDMKNFEEIKSTETFEAITNVVIYQNLIIIQIFENEERMFILILIHWKLYQIKNL